MQWLDFDGRRLRGERPFDTWQWNEGDEATRGDALADLRTRWKAGRDRFPRGGLIGYFGYDFARTLEPRAFAKDTASPPHDIPVPAARWTFFEELHVAALGDCSPSNHQVGEDGCPQFAGAPGVPSGALPTSADTDDQYERNVGRILDYIAAGDIYQANLTRRFSAPLRQSPLELYKRLGRAPMPMSALLEYADFALVSHSPERFWSLRNGAVSAHPIKGTRARGETPQADKEQRRKLASSAKDRAENVMIVDLLRNDIGRVCEYGSVSVPQLFEACAFPTVWHGVSTVTGTLRAHCDVFDLLRATFPCGSISGAPKIRAMQIIDRLEPVRRGAAMGAIGFIDFAGDADFNVAIRTATCFGQRIFFHAGGGIVADSEAAAERREVEIKTRALRGALLS